MVLVLVILVASMAIHACRNESALGVGGEIGGGQVDEMGSSPDGDELDRNGASPETTRGIPELPEGQCLGTQKCTKSLLYKFTFDLTSSAGISQPTLGKLQKAPFVLEDVFYNFQLDGRVLEEWTLSSVGMGLLEIRRTAIGPPTALEIGREYLVTHDTTSWGEHVVIEDSALVVLEHALITQLSDVYEVTTHEFCEAEFSVTGFCDVYPQDFEGCLCSVPVQVKMKYCESESASFFEGWEWRLGGGGDWFELFAARQGFEENGDSCIRIVYETRHWVEVVEDD